MTRTGEKSFPKRSEGFSGDTRLRRVSQPKSRMRKLWKAIRARRRTWDRTLPAC